MSTDRAVAPEYHAHLHARRRAYERYRVHLTDADLARVEALIRSGRDGPDCVWARGFYDPARRLYAVRFGFRWLPVLYEAATGCVVTVLPPFVLSRYPETRRFAS